MSAHSLSSYQTHHRRIENNNNWLWTGRGPPFLFIHPCHLYVICNVCYVINKKTKQKQFMLWLLLIYVSNQNKNRFVIKSKRDKLFLNLKDLPLYMTSLTPAGIQCAVRPSRCPRVFSCKQPKLQHKSSFWFSHFPEWNNVLYILLSWPETRGRHDREDNKPQARQNVTHRKSVMIANSKVALGQVVHPKFTVKEASIDIVSREQQRAARPAHCEHSVLIWSRHSDALLSAITGSEHVCVCDVKLL